MLPAASFTAKSGKFYECSTTAATDGGPITAATGLDKCAFSVSIKGTDLDLASGDVEFGINFNGFNEMANLNLPYEFSIWVLVGGATCRYYILQYYILQ
jgi:hypothetical protein